MHPAKATVVSDLNKKLNESPFLFVTDYSGVDVVQFGELRNRLIEARQLIDQQAAAQQQMAQTLSELAEQNARLVEAVQLLRVRTRVLIVVVVLLVVGVAVLLAR